MKSLLLLIGVSPLFAAAQQPAAFLRKALLANGAWEKIRAFEYHANRYSLYPWQSYAFDKPKEEKDLYECYFDKGSSAMHDHTITHYPGGYVFNFIGIGREQAYYEYDVNRSRAGKALFKYGKQQFTDNYNALLGYFPYYMLKEVLDSGDSLQLQHINQEVSIIRKLPTGIQEFKLDAATGVLHQYNKQTAGGVDTWYFEDYKMIDGCLIPGKVKQVLRSSRVYTDHLVGFKVKSMLPSSLFALPMNYKQVELSHQAPTVKEIEKDIYLVEKVDGDRNVIFINMGNYIVLTEAPVSEEATQSVLELVHKTLPGKPVKYVHLSHFHKDHIAGLGKLVDEGATIICTPTMEKPIRQLLKDRQPSFVFFSGNTSISGGNHQVNLFEVPNSHAQGLSFLYLPQQSIIYEGDLLSMPEDGTITPAIQVSKEFYTFLKKKGLRYKRIIGHHGLSDIKPAVFEHAMGAANQLADKFLKPTG
jgi:glyoxylase-like metal-dependent hydrolase (beta-lactamase superfamily II)